MRTNVFFKVLVLGGLAIAIWVALAMITGVVSERARYRKQVVAEIARSTAQDQRLIGPLLVVHYRERVTSVDGKTSTTRDLVELLMPDSLVVDSRAQVEERRRGIYGVPVFRAANHLTAAFDLHDRFGIEPDRDLVGEPEVEVVLGVSDPRGMHTAPAVRLDGAPLVARPGTGLAWLAHGISARLEVRSPHKATIDVDVEMVGTDQLMFVPVGGINNVQIQSNWPHPGFVGGFLPDERSVSKDGFRANWHLSRFATGGEDALSSASEAAGPGLQKSDLGVHFVQPVDVYQQSERAVKYGMLFVLLTFVAFFLFEVLRRLAIHPIQYTLCGAALALFFLLLVSLCEHLPFGMAYLVASAACVGLLSFYVGHVLRSVARGLGFSGLLGALYAFLYVVLRSEDYALVLGTLLLFAALATVMIMTRRVDWYGLEARVAPSP